MAPPGNSRSASPGRQLELAGRGLQGGPAPALEGGLGSHGVGQPVAQFGVGIGWIWVIFSAHTVNIGGCPGFPRVFPCDTTAAS